MNCASSRTRGADGDVAPRFRWRRAGKVGHNAAMFVVALDTTTRPGSHALVRDGAVLVVQAGDAAHAHAERLPGDVLASLTAHGLSPRDVDLFAVAAGPGSFTGLRIGIAAMQGLAFATGTPIIGVSALDALAYAAAAQVAPKGAVAAWMDAQRGEVFAALYRPAASSPALLETVDEARVAGPADVLARWRGMGVDRAVFAGDGAVKYRVLLDAWPEVAGTVLEPVPLLAPAVARLAAARFAQGGTFVPHAVEPIYVRRPDAELARDRREAGS